MEVPQEADAQVVVVVVRGLIVVDIETLPVEVANINAVVVRIQILYQLPSIGSGSRNFTAFWLICSPS